MPVITLYYSRLSSILKRPLPKQDLIDTLPYLGLDIEEEAEDHVRVEFNPNRPDFSSEWGIARALNGLLGFEKGAPKYAVKKPCITLKVDQSIIDYRSFFVGAVVRELDFDNESIRQIMAMQDDLDNGIGRRRSKVSTGIHNLDAVTPPFTYKAVSPDFRFTPLGYEDAMSMKEILRDVETGQKYRHIVEKFPVYPLIIDSKDRVISFPPIINGVATKVTNKTKNLLIDITSSNMKAAEDVLAVLLAAFSDLGGKLEFIEVKYPTFRKVTPDLTPIKMSVKYSYINKLLGLNLSATEIIECLERSRIDVKVNNSSMEVQVPRYRYDILHPIDIVEEVIIGYNLTNITPTLPESADVGELNTQLATLDSAREVLVGLGLIEVMNYSLISRDTIFDTTESQAGKHLRVENPKTGEHEYLRESLIPSLLINLSKNIHEIYPQRIFEVGKTFKRDSTLPKEEYKVAVAIAHDNANYTEAKSILTSFIIQLNGLKCSTKPTEGSIYIGGRAALIEIKGRSIGKIGEVSPTLLEKFNLRVPVSAFEISIDEM